MVKQKYHVRSAKLEFEHISLWLPPERASLVQRLSALLPCSASGQAQQADGKQLLNDVSGMALPGRMLAVMGPSGAGKTTLLGVLAGDPSALNSGRLEGRVLLGGQERRLDKFRQISAHVKQDDILLPTTTPREALQFAAALRLPCPHYSREQQDAAVAQLIDGMKLDNCADTLVGDATAGMKGLSGGERRRLANAVELLGGPAVFLSDEPTSGQDSSTAVQVLQYMKAQINGAGGVLIITLHQPGSEVSALVDDLLLLGYGGSPAFMGPWGAALHYFTCHIGLNLPPHTGLADWLLALLDKEAHQQQLQQQQQQQHSLKQLQTAPHQQYPPTFLQRICSHSRGGAYPNRTTGGGSSSFVTLSSSNGGSGTATTTSTDSGSHSATNSSLGGSCCNPKGSILLHARSGSSGSSCSDSSMMVNTPRANMASAWQRYVSSGRAAAIAAPYYVAADAASLLAAGLNPQEYALMGNPLPGLSEITEVGSDEDADIIITTIVMDPQDGTPMRAATPLSLPAMPRLVLPARSPSPSAAAAAAQLPATPCSHKETAAVAAVAAGQQRPALGVARASLAVQVRVLAGRAFRWWLRNPAMLLSEAGQYLFVVLFLGSLYPRLATSGQAAAADRLAALYLWLTCIMITTPARALLSWDQERRLLHHEMSSGLYSLTPFLLGTKLLVTLPLEIGVVAATGALLYVLLGLQAVAAKFWSFMALSVFLAVCAANLGNAICLVMTDMHFKLPALCITATLLLAFAGFVVQAIPVWWTWLGHASFCTYAYAGLVRNEFESLALQLPVGAAAATALKGPADSVRSRLAALGLTSLSAATAALQGNADRSVTVDGLSLVPKTVNVHLFDGVGGFIGVGAAFALGSSIFVLLMTVLVVRLRRQ